MSDISPSPQPFLERLSDGLQQLIQVVIGSHRKPHLTGTDAGRPHFHVVTSVKLNGGAAS